MSYAKLYSRANVVQMEGAENLLQEYRHLVKWENPGGIKLLDIGCRDGNILVKVLLEEIPSKAIDSVLGVDVSKDMLREARRKYGNHPKVSFAPFDVESRSCETIGMFGPYSHITSFYWLDWVQDQGQTYKNIYKLLKPGGQFFGVFIRKHGLPPVYNELAETSKWKMFLKDWWDHIPPYCMDPKWRNVLEEHLKAAGFSEYQIELDRQVGHLVSEQALKESIQTMDYFHHRVPETFREGYMKDLLRIFHAQTVPRSSRLEHAYEAIVLSATKPE